MSGQNNFESIYHQHKDRVYNLCLNYVQNQEDAEELAQDVFMKIYNNLASFGERSSVATWIYRITVNTCNDFVKSQKRQKRFAFFTALFHPVTNEPVKGHADFNHPGILLESREQLERLFALINTLPENQKTAVLLTRLDGMPQQEVASVMEISVKAVESLLQRAKENIQKKLSAAKDF